MPVQGTLVYTVDTGEKPVNMTVGPGGRGRTRSGVEELHNVAIQDGRPSAARLSLDVEGFVLVERPTQTRDFWDEAQVKKIYYPEVERLVADLTGAASVLIFDHTLRSGDPTRQEDEFAREPVSIVHNDYTEWSGPQRVRDLLAPEDAQRRLCGRFAVVQVWRPIRGPVLADPLAICDARSMEPGDLIAAERRHPDRVGEIYQLAYNPRHRWFYFPRMSADESLVFKCYDSEADGRARFTAHASFADPTTPPNAPPRESIEMRTLAFFSDA